MHFNPKLLKTRGAKRLFLVAYDISDPKRLRKILKAVRYFSVGGQKSVHECYLNQSEKKFLINRFKKIADLSIDQLFLIPLATNLSVELLGIAQPAISDEFVILS